MTVWHADICMTRRHRRGWGEIDGVGKAEISGQFWVGEEDVNKKGKGKNLGGINENEGAVG